MVSLFLTWTIVCFSLGEGHNHRHHRSHHHKPDRLSSTQQAIVEKKNVPRSFWKEVTVPAQNSSLYDSQKAPWTFEDFAATHDLDQQVFQHAFEKNSRETLHQRKKIPHGFVESKASRHVISNRKSHVAEEMYNQEIFPDEVEEKTTQEPKKADMTFAEPVRMRLPVPHHTTAPNDGLGAARWTHRFHDKEAERALNYTRKTVKASIGGAAFLSCRVGHLGDRQISWIRSRDWHVLTSGKSLYTHDKRFLVLHEPGSQDWILQIKAVSMKDAGNYECQVSTGTGIISMFVHLKIVTPKAFIPGHGQYVVNRGSPISITCFIRKSPSPPQYIFWHHEGKLLNFIKSDPQITLTTNLDFRDDLANLALTSKKRTKHPKEYFSRLDVLDASEHHSGNYTCNTPHSKTASTYVFVTEGDKTAAVQRIDTSGGNKINIYTFYLSLSYLLCLIL